MPKRANAAFELAKHFILTLAGDAATEGRLLVIFNSDLNSTPSAEWALWKSSVHEKFVSALGNPECANVIAKQLLQAIKRGDVQWLPPRSTDGAAITLPKRASVSTELEKAILRGVDQGLRGERLWSYIDEQDVTTHPKEDGFPWPGSF